MALRAIVFPIQIFCEEGGELGLLKIIKTICRYLGYKHFRGLSHHFRQQVHQDGSIKATENDISKGSDRDSGETFNRGDQSW